ncbi:MAG: Fic family protein [Brachymonas sp.]|nr:Fic family protein [Brachymonas sp.]
MGRAVADHVLAQELDTSQRIFSLSRQIQAERKAYYDQLGAATLAVPHAGQGIDVTPWVLWFIGVFTRGCQHSLSVIRLASEKAAFWQRCAAIDLNVRQRKVLNRLLDAGDGGFLGGLTAEKYIKITQASKATATRDLAHLYQTGLLGIQGQGKGTRYAVAITGWHADFKRRSVNPSLQDFS